MFPERQVATIDEVRQCVTFATPGAWRWLAWCVTEPDSGRVRVLPYEAFATLPS
jgi:hypothetical protein